MYQCDILVVGSGIAGLTFAIKVAEKRPDLQLFLLSKDELSATNTQYAQGGIAVVIDKLHDSFTSHIQDTLNSGGGLSDIKVVEHVIQTAPIRLLELQEYGVQFTKDFNGKFELGLEGGHSANRIVHAKDQTGLAIETTLINKIETLKNITVFTHHYAIDIILQDTNGLNKGVIGVSALDIKNKKIVSFKSTVTLLATGGCGQVFKHTTNPSVATGDGVAIAYRAGALISNMKFIQFHPTALFEKEKDPLFLISEAVRGFGAHVRNFHGDRFLFNVSEKGELATRDVVSKAIVDEMEKSGGSFVYLDCRHLDYSKVKNEFPSITKYCEQIGYNMATDLIPIVPAAHYQCGGITVNQNGRTSLNHLYAIGECSDTGLHGKNRLASNSLLEALVYAHDAAMDAVDSIKSIDKNTFDDLKITELELLADKKSGQFILETQTMMSQYCAVNPSKEQIELASNALNLLNNLYRKNKSYTTPTSNSLSARNILQVARIIIEHKLSN